MIKLLHVDDDQDVREITQMALEFSGEFEFIQCDSGEAALLKVERFRPDVLLLDVMMPGLTGPLTLKKIRELQGFDSIPAIFLTARTSTDNNRELRDLGALDIITKPFDPMFLGQQIKTAMDLGSI